MSDWTDGQTRARVCVLRAEGDGVEPVLVLQFEKGDWCPLNHGTAVGPPQYIFGAPEGLSRLLLTHRRILGESGPALPSPSLKAVFTSSVEPSQIGGLVGLFLRLKSDGHDKVHLFGPSGLQEPLLFSSRNIVRWTYPSVLLTEYSSSGNSNSQTEEERKGKDPSCLAYSDHLIEVFVTCASPEEDWSILEEKGSDHHGVYPDPSVFKPTEGAPICSNGNRPVAGQSNQSEWGTTTRPILAHCIQFRKMEKLLVMVECSSSEEVTLLENSAFWKALVTKRSDDVMLVLHRCHPQVVQTENYRKQLVHALPSATHVDMHTNGHMEFGFSGSLKTLLKLHEVDKAMFPLPNSQPQGSSSSSSLAPLVVAGEEEKKKESIMSTSRGILTCYRVLEDGTCILDDDAPQDELNAQFSSGKTQVPALDDDRGGQKGEETNRSVAAQLRDSLAKFGTAKEFKPKVKRQRTLSDTKVTFLGTGCAEPSKYRGGTGILVECPSGSILLDAGESVWGQMIRRFGKRVALQKLSAISCIWISHHHADHLLGLISLLHHRASPNRLLLVGPFVALNWLKCFRSNLGSNYIFKHHTHLNRDHTCMNFLRQLGITSFESVPVYHCRDAHAAVFTHQDGWKISFSGDKRPCKAFVEAGKGSTLLIHEATFETKYHSHAVRKKHCTIKEALEIAKEVGAKMTILTHFSQGYPHIPLELNEHIGKEEGKTTPVVAFDGMCIELSRLSEYSEIMPRVSSTLLESVAAESSKR